MLSRCERMEQENKKKKRKRTREEKGHENKIVGCSTFEENNNNAKKRGFEISFMNKDKDKVKEEEESCVWDSDCSNNLAFGVFDFPWLKDGIISKPEDLELDFEDNYFMSSCLEHQDTCSFKVSGIDLSDEYGLCETSQKVSMSHIPESNKLVEDAWKQFDDSNNGLELEPEDVDNSTWTSLFNHPL